MAKEKYNSSNSITQKLSKNKFTSKIIPISIAISSMFSSCISNETKPIKEYTEYSAELGHNINVIEYSDFKIEKEKGHNKVYYMNNATPVIYTHQYMNDKDRNSVELCITSDNNPEEVFGITDRTAGFIPGAETQKFNIAYNDTLSHTSINNNEIKSKEEHDAFDIIVLNNGQQIMLIKDSSNAIVYGEANRLLSLAHKTSLCVTTTSSNEDIVRVKNYGLNNITDNMGSQNQLMIKRK